MANYLVKFNALKKKNDKEKELLSKIEECINNISNIKEQLDWDGPSKEKFIYRFNIFVSDLNKMLENLRSCLNVTEQFHDRFYEAHHNINKRLTNFQDEMVNIWKIQG